jgi:hypothetical protein
MNGLDAGEAPRFWGGHPPFGTGAGPTLPPPTTPTNPWNAGMEEMTSPTSFGPYRLTRELGVCELARRYLAVHETEQTSHLVYELGPCFDRAERRRLVEAIEPLLDMRHPHVLGIDHFSFVGVGGGVGNRPWASAPYPGNQKGLVTLSDLVAEKGGQMDQIETDRLLRQLLEAMDYVHSAGCGWGEIEPRRVLVDRSGRAVAELVGVARRLEGLRGVNAEFIRDEVRAMVALGYKLITGHEPDELMMMPASRLVRKLDRRWDLMFEEGLDAAGGFATAREAIDALPSTERVGPERGRDVLTVKTVLGRVRGALRVENDE